MAQAEGVPCPGAAPGQPCVFKLVLLGSGSVGKSSLALRYVKNDFKSILPTVGCAFFTKVVELGAVSLKFEIWDTAGQEKYHSICHLYFRGANAALLVYDITRKDSFCKAQQWLQDLERQVPAGEVVVMLVGNKTDLGEQREVTFQEGKEFAESKRLLFMEASAKLNHQVTEVFSALGERRGPQEGRGGGCHPSGCFVGSGDQTGGLQGPRVSTIARGPNFVALGEGQLGGGGGVPGLLGGVLPSQTAVLTLHSPGTAAERRGEAGPAAEGGGRAGSERGARGAGQVLRPVAGAGLPGACRGHPRGAPATVPGSERSWKLASRSVPTPEAGGNHSGADPRRRPSRGDGGNRHLLAFVRPAPWRPGKLYFQGQNDPAKLFKAGPRFLPRAHGVHWPHLKNNNKLKNIYIYNTQQGAFPV
uniref:Ras-related protein Rab-17 n=1 Tax=Canis lupus familiaris TaxID=9615 RepID=A0A8P0TBN4_CANLF